MTTSINNPYFTHQLLNGTVMLKVGLTGGIGSGKTTIAGLFEILGVPVYYADERAKQLMVDESLRDQISECFGEDSYLEDGLLNRKYLADKVFNDPVRLKQLNAIVHPAVAKDFSQWTKTRVQAPYVLKEAALIFETGGHAILDRTILVWAPEALRIQRVVERDNVSERDVLARMAHQLSDHEKVPLADFVIVNDGAHPLVRQVMEIHKLLSHTVV